MPTAVLQFTPYALGVGSPVASSTADPPLGLCNTYSLNQQFCPSIRNNRLMPVREWVYDPNGTVYGVFEDGSRWDSLTIPECAVQCPGDPALTAYIGTGPDAVWGTVVDPVI